MNSNNNKLKESFVKINKRSQLVLPKTILDELNIHEGDFLKVQVSNRQLILNKVILVDESQEWFWTDKWQEEEKNVEKERQQNNIEKYDSINELINDLNK